MQDNDPKHTASSTNDLIRGTMEKLGLAKSSTALNPIEHAFHLLRGRLNGV